MYFNISSYIRLRLNNKLEGVVCVIFHIQFCILLNGVMLATSSDVNVIFKCVSN